MNRTLAGAAALFVVLVAARARAQVPLVVGSVRDQHGAPIAAALVTGKTAAQARASATTDASGTFALHGAGIVLVQIDCRYCQSTVVTVIGEEPVVVIVHRYDALLDQAPSTADLENLPYAHIESSVALRPFTLLAQTSTPYPGPVLSDRGLSSYGSLLIDDGAPNYDIVAGESPYEFIPAQYEQSAVVRDATNAYAYGNQAAGGIVTLDPFLSGSNAGVAELGSDTIVRAQVGSDWSAVALDSFSNNEESRQRGDVMASWSLGADQSLSVMGGTEQGREYESPQSPFAGNFSFADASFTDPRALNLTLSAVSDRGDYVSNVEEYPVSTIWSDAGFNAGIHSNGTLVAFANAGVRSSTGFENQMLPYSFGNVAATLQQTQLDAGVTTATTTYDVTAAVGAFWFNYAGGTNGFSQPARTALAVPSLDLKLFPGNKWSLELQESGSFALPTFTQQYLTGDEEYAPIELQRNALQAATLSYTDDARIRFAVEEALENVGGAYPGKISSAGLSAIWQIAPDFSLRAWTMHVSDTSQPFGVLPYDGVAPTVASAWLTYENAGVLRADVIYRRDLLDDVPFYHVDGAISGPIGDRLRWYAGAEDRLRRTFVDVGVRYAGR